MKQVLLKVRDILRIAFTFGDGVVAQGKIFLAGFLSPLRRIAGLDPSFSVPVHMKAFGRSFVFTFTSGTDFAVFDEVFFQREYEYDLPVPPRTIFDLGSNTGISVIYFRLKYPQARIFAFEPDPKVFAILKQNTAQFSDIYPFPIAVAGKDGKRKFFINPQSSISSSLVSRRDTDHCTEIDAKTLPSFRKELAIPTIDLLKFDIEGGELETFRVPGVLNGVSAFVGELHADLIPGTKDEFLSWFEKFDIQEIPLTATRSIIKGKQQIR